jgi:nucleotide-binding universal stress UspA family protein
MFKNILVPTDFSQTSRRALDVAVDLAALSRAKLFLLHVIEIIEDTTFEELKDFYMRLERRSRKDMDDVLAAYHDRSIDIETRILYGNRIRQILQFAGDREVDLIVMSSHRMDVQSPSGGWGTISHKVGILSPYPVMLVK